jgi:hypothetical protein
MSPTSYQTAPPRTTILTWKSSNRQIGVFPIGDPPPTRELLRAAKLTRALDNISEIQLLIHQKYNQKNQLTLPLLVLIDHTGTPHDSSISLRTQDSGQAKLNQMDTAIVTAELAVVSLRLKAQVRLADPSSRLDVLVEFGHFVK